MKNTILLQIDRTLAAMLAIGKTLVSEDLIEKQFVCDLRRCKGACCVKGDGGAPLDKKELRILKDIYKEVEPYMTGAGKAAIRKHGLYIKEENKQYSTPLVDKTFECAYSYLETDGTAKCAIEAAFLDGKIKFRKPVSCHLYPVRINSFDNYDAVNYERWKICSPACDLGKQLQVPVYKFVKDALIRKYGESWYAELDEAAKYLETK